MAYDEKVAERIRKLFENDLRVSEKKMFGGLAFLLNGNMAVAASGQGGIMVRVDPDESAELVRTTPAEFMVMQGRQMPGWLRVGSEALAEQVDLESWVMRGVDFAESLPAK